MIGGLVRRTFASAVDAVHSNPEPRPTTPPTTPAPAPTAVTPKRKTRLRRVLQAALDITLVLALGLTIFVAYGLVGNRWYRVVAVEGGSMEPTIMRGDLIVTTPAPEKVERGMILVMVVDGRMVTHRVVEVRADGSLVTKGDANPTPDDWQGKPILVYGEYRFAIPALGGFLPISNASGASFTDRAVIAQRVTVGSWMTPQPGDPATPSPSPTDLEPTATAAAPDPTPSAAPTTVPEPTMTPDPTPSAAPTTVPEPAMTPDPTPSAAPTTVPEPTVPPDPTPPDAPTTEPTPPPA